MANEIIKVLDELCNKFGIVVNWADQNVLSYVQELSTKCVNWKMGISIVHLIYGIVLLGIGIFGIWGTKYCYNKCKTATCSNDRCLWDWGCFLMCCVCSVSFMGFFIFVPSSIENIITCKMFPEKILIDTIMEMSGK